MANKIKSEGNQAFNVPNTPEGLLFIKQLRQFSNKKKKNEFRARGRGKRDRYAQKVGKYTAQTGLSSKFATWFAVYMDNDTNARQQLVSRLHADKIKLQVENAQFSDEITRLVKLTEQAKSDLFLENEITRLKAEIEVRTQQPSKTIQGLKMEVARLVDNLNYYRNESEKYYCENGNLKKKIEGYERRENIIKNQVKADHIPLKADHIPQTQGITITVPKGININIVEG